MVRGQSSRRLTAQELKSLMDIQLQNSRFQGVVHELTDICWELCVDKPSTRLDSRTENCLRNCVERFIDTTNYITNRLEQMASSPDFDMFSRIRGFLNRHKRKFIVSGVVIGGFIILSRYTQRRLREWQEKEIREQLEKCKRKQHFESTERTCNQTIITLCSGLRNSVVKSLDTEAIVEKLRNGCNDKIATWNRLKVVAISRCAAIVYSHVMLVTLLRIKVNLIGGHMFKDSLDLEGGISADSATQQMYLSLCHNFMSEGVSKLCNLLLEKVEEITSSTSLGDKLTLRDLEQIYWAIASSMSSDPQTDPVKNMARYMLPDPSEYQNNAIVNKMVIETVDLLESEDVQNVAQSMVRTGFVLLVDHVAEYFVPIEFEDGLMGKSGKVESDLQANSLPSTSNGHAGGVKIVELPTTNGFLPFNRVTIPMAKLIPIINGQVPESSNPGDLPSDWLQKLILSDKLRTLGANVYEAFSF